VGALRGIWPFAGHQLVCGEGRLSVDMALPIGATRCSMLPRRSVGEDRCVVNSVEARPLRPAELFFATAAEVRR
jgi:hypothetical protein